MINLIPPAARRAVTIEYWTRVVIIWLCLFLLAVIIIAVLQLPSYVLIKSQLRAYEIDYLNAKSQ